MISSSNMSRRKNTLSKPWRITLSSILLIVLISFGLWLLLAGKNIAVLNPQGIVAEQQKNLILFTLLLSLVVVVPVFTMLGVIAWKYREGSGAHYTPDVAGNRKLEAIWWGIPIFIIGILSVVTWVSTHQLDPYKPLESNIKPLRVQVVALQWKWLFIYPDQGVASLNELRIPVGTPVNFELTADGPMSAMWIPNLGSQTYAMTGMNSKLSLQADKAGVYRGSNSNINGKGYAEMDFNTIAMPTSQAFYKWADSIRVDGSHDHMDWTTYKDLAKQSQGNPKTYYHLHDPGLYTKVMEKFMPTGHAKQSSEAHDEHMEGMGH